VSLFLCQSFLGDFSCKNQIAIAIISIACLNWYGIAITSICLDKELFKTILQEMLELKLFFIADQLNIQDHKLVAYSESSCNNIRILYLFHYKLKVQDG